MFAELGRAAEILAYNTLFIVLPTNGHWYISFPSVETQRFLAVSLNPSKPKSM